MKYKLNKYIHLDFTKQNLEDYLIEDFRWKILDCVWGKVNQDLYEPLRNQLKNTLFGELDTNFHRLMLKDLRLKL